MSTMAIVAVEVVVHTVADINLEFASLLKIQQLLVVKAG